MTFQPRHPLPRIRQFGEAGIGVFPEIDGDSILHFNQAVGSNVRVEIQGYVAQGMTAELSLVLCAPSTPVRSVSDDGYTFQFGADFMALCKLARDGQDIAFSPEYQLEAGKEYTVMAEMVDGIARFFVSKRNTAVKNNFFDAMVLSSSNNIVSHCHHNVPIKQ